MKLRALKRLRARDERRRPIGNKCKGFEASCIVCMSHKIYQETGRFPAFEEAWQRMKEQV